MVPSLKNVESQDFTGAQLVKFHFATSTAHKRQESFLQSQLVHEDLKTYPHL
jgi:hypothetical protein